MEMIGVIPTPNDGNEVETESFFATAAAKLHYPRFSLVSLQGVSCVSRTKEDEFEVLLDEPSDQ